VISGLDAAGASVAGTAYTDDFTVAPPSSTVSVSGGGCVLSPASSTGVYTLTVTRADAGPRACTVTAIGTAATTAVAAIAFTAAPPPPSATLGAPTGLECAWPTQAGGKVECTWDPVTGATGGYAVRYELTLDLRGTIRTIAREKTESSTGFSIGLNKYLTQARLQTAAVGPDRTGPYTAWATVCRVGATGGPTHDHDGLGCHSTGEVHPCRSGQHRDPDHIRPISGYIGCHPIDEVHVCGDGLHFHREADHHLSSCHSDHVPRSHPAPILSVGSHGASLERFLRSLLNSTVQFPRTKNADIKAIFDASLARPSSASAATSSRAERVCPPGQHFHILVSGCHADDDSHPSTPLSLSPGGGTVPAEHLFELADENNPVARTVPAASSGGSGVILPADATAATVTVKFDYIWYQCLRWHRGSVPDWASGTGLLNVYWLTRPRSSPVMTTADHFYRFAEKPGSGEAWTGYTPCYIPVLKHEKAIVATAPVPNSNTGLAEFAPVVTKGADGSLLPACNHEDLRQKVTRLWEAEEDRVEASMHPYPPYTLPDGLADVPWHGSPVTLVAIPHYHLYECINTKALGSE
jgi:hypothetical protein